MNSTTTKLDIKLYPPEAQGAGQFDGGRITETKPLGFPGEGPDVPNVGPLFYWAWATAEGYGKIGLHPHQAFEIMSYALEGEIGHYDTLGNRSRVKTGGAQVMQTGSGVSHEEETIGDRTEFFQIWFDPHLSKTISDAPTYREFSHDDFPRAEQDGVIVKSVIGGQGPISLKSEVVMKDITISSGHQFLWNLKADRSLAVVVIDGEGVVVDEDTGRKDHITKKDFARIHAQTEGTVCFQATMEGALRLAIIEVPATVNYPLYRERSSAVRG